MSILKVDTINEKTTGNGVAIPNHVVQAKCVEWDTAFTHNSGTTVDLMSGQITIQQGSKIIALASIGRFVNATGTWGQAYECRMYVGTTLIQDTEHVGANATGAVSFQHNLMGETDALNAGTYTIKITGSQIVSVNSHLFNRSPRSSWLIMQEIAQ